MLPNIRPFTILYTDEMCYIQNYVYFCIQREEMTSMKSHVHDMEQKIRDLEKKLQDKITENANTNEDLQVRNVA